MKIVLQIIGFSLLVNGCVFVQKEEIPEENGRSLKPFSFFLFTGDTITDTLHCGILSKHILIDDSTYIWILENEESFIIVDTVPDGQISPFEFSWGKNNMIALIRGCGTYCWSNTIIELTNSPILNIYQYSAIDTLSMNIIEIAEEKFIITNLETKNAITVPNNYYKYRKKGYPLFYIEITDFTHSTIKYEIRLDNGEKIKKEIQV
ncbi:MAG: hypothetical protein FWH36_02580 [Lentimicrobiaceae bacterium]|nr:hypothetical protein [Lentimicrobiaceae bacterium]